jgi:hypothetical protein
MDWTDFFSGIATAGTSIASAVIGPRVPSAIPGNPGAIYIPPAAGGQVIQTGGILGGGLGGGSNSILIILLIGLVLVFALRN